MNARFALAHALAAHGITLALALFADALLCLWWNCSDWSWMAILALSCLVCAAVSAAHTGSPDRDRGTDTPRRHERERSSGVQRCDDAGAPRRQGKKALTRHPTRQWNYL